MNRSRPLRRDLTWAHPIEDTALTLRAMLRDSPAGNELAQFLPHVVWLSRTGDSDNDIRPFLNDDETSP